jgi:hypothetical protein
MSTESKQGQELKRKADEVPMTGDDPPGDDRARLDELLERGEISAEAFAEYSAAADAAVSLRAAATPTPRDVGRRLTPKRKRDAPCQ